MIVTAVDRRTQLPKPIAANIASIIGVAGLPLGARALTRVHYTSRVSEPIY